MSAEPLPTPPGLGHTRPDLDRVRSVWLGAADLLLGFVPAWGAAGTAGSEVRELAGAVATGAVGAGWVTVVTAPPSSPSSFVQTRREGGVTSM